MTTPHPLTADERRTPEDFEDAATLLEAMAGWAPSTEPICHFCRHLATSGGMTCAAYPDGIPWEIQAGQVDHRLPYAGDHGVHYDPLTPEEFRARAAELRAEAARLRQRGAAD
jgi:hypothetical protein